MAAIIFFGYFFLGVGPQIVFYLFFVATKSFLTLLSLISAFLWLTVLLVTSGIFRGFVPIDETKGSYAGVLVGALVIQELVRYAVWRVNRKVVEVLEGMARARGHRFNALDRLQLALAWGVGHAGAHVTFFYVSLLPLTSGDATFYTDTCPRMALFMLGSLYSLAFSMILTAAMVLYFDGCHWGNKLHVVAGPLLQAGSALLTINNMNQGGCMVTMPLLLAVGVASATYCGQLCWRRGTLSSPGPISPAAAAM